MVGIKGNQTQKRIDGILKVTGQALYPADVHYKNLAYGRLVTSTIGKGRILTIDTAKALAVPGVLAIFTHENIDGIRPVKHIFFGGYANSSHCPLSSPEILYHGQIVALVCATSLETAAEGASLLQIDYKVDDGVWSLADDRATPVPLTTIFPGFSERQVGDIEKGLQESSFTLDQTYSTPIQHHNPIELFSTTCAWNEDKLTVHEPARFVYGVQHGLAAQLGIDPENVRVVSNFIGGHFGSKFALSQHTALCAVAAKHIGYPLHIQATRSNGFTIANHRPDTSHRVRLGIDAQGKLLALGHEAVSSTSRFDNFIMTGTDLTTALYDSPNIESKESLASVDRNTPGPMRAPSEVPYLFALESAIDEIACLSQIDPIELRRKNDTTKDPVTGQQFTTRHLMRCFDEGAKLFDWSRRKQSTGAIEASVICRPAVAALPCRLWEH